LEVGGRRFAENHAENESLSKKVSVVQVKQCCRLPASATIRAFSLFRKFFVEKTTFVLIKELFQSNGSLDELFDPFVMGGRPWSWFPRRITWEALAIGFGLSFVRLFSLSFTWH
jgi:hypothetical protein